ncbi:cell division protein [Bombilactobacillus bombi]|uniref:cell division protein n=1 Tax=Bombilactobacillus bombi TaxID=1303590 RepID=UPI0015E59F2D|nr:cell division protein [Bombilactobacillus bombi]MBA1435204.1 cell division protein [Bombilactobacillus bombi]
MKSKRNLSLTADLYFQKGHWLLKIGQTLVAILGWLAVLFPFYWVITPLLAPNLATKLKIAYYGDEFQLLHFLALFFGGFLIFIIIFYIGVTIWNNHRFQHILARRKVVNQKKQHAREDLIEKAWQQRFGDQLQRHQVRFYSVKPQQNLDTHFTQNLFKEDDTAK